MNHNVRAHVSSAASLHYQLSVLDGTALPMCGMRHFGSSYVTPKDACFCSLHVPVNMARLPSQLLLLLNGSLADPYLLPTMSAIPSPPHMRDKTIRPTGDSRQNSKVTAVTMPMYSKGPLSNSCLLVNESKVDTDRHCSIST